MEPNRLVKKGELLFRIDPTQYQNDLNVAKAKLVADEAKFAQAGAGLVDASAGARQLQEQLKSASGQVSGAAAETRACAAAGPAEPGTGGHGRRRPLRAGAGGGQRDRTGGPDRDGKSERSAGRAKTVGTGQRRAGVGRGGPGAARDREGAGRREPRGSSERAVEPRPDGRLCADQRLRDQRAAAAGLVRDRVSGGAGDELRRGGIPGHRALRAERIAAGRAWQPGGIHAQDVSGPRHQGDGGFHRLGAGAGPGGAVGHAAADRRVSAGAGPLPGQVRRRRARPAAVPRRRRGWRTARSTPSMRTRSTSCAW